MRCRSLAMAACLCLAGSIAGAQEFVPFVIPARPNPDSLIAYKPDPITGEADRLAVRSGHLHAVVNACGFEVNLSFRRTCRRTLMRSTSRHLAAAKLNTVRLLTWIQRGVREGGGRPKTAGHAPGRSTSSLLPINSPGRASTLISICTWGGHTVVHRLAQEQHQL